MGRVVAAGGVAQERLRTCVRVEVSIDVHECLNTSSCVDVASGVQTECPCPSGRVVVPGCVILERGRPSGRVEATLRVAVERIKTNGCILEAGGETEKRIITLSGALVRIASVRCWENRSG